jgi:RNA polymerase sigma-70 factor, ECF subfamily
VTGTHPEAEVAAPSEAASLEHAVLELSPSIYRVALSILRDQALAEDALQETLIRVWSNLDRFRGDAPFRVWVLRIAHNVAISMGRKRRDQAVDPHDLGEIKATEAVPERTAEGRAMVGALWEALEHLDPLSRAIVVLREVELFAYEDIAEALDIPLATVKTRLFRARRSLATTLETWR